MGKYLLARVIEGTDEWFNHVILDNGKYAFIRKENEKICVSAPCTQDGYNTLYAIGKSLWDSDMCSKFEIAAFDDGEMFWKTRPDQWNFERGRYKSWFDSMIAEELQSFRSEDFQNDPLELKYVQDYQKRFWDCKTDCYVPEAFQSLIRDTQLHEDIETVRGLNLGFEDVPEVVGFEHKGTWIVNPFYDETLRFEVEPFSYYGEENVKKFIADVISKSRSFSHFKDQIRNKGGIWATDDVHFTQFRDGFGASYLPDFPNHSSQDCAISYNWLSNKWSLVSPEQYKTARETLEGKISNAEAKKASLKQEKKESKEKEIEERR